MGRPSNGSTTLDSAEVEAYGLSSQRMRRKLLDAGAPIMGIAHLWRMLNYDWFLNYGPADGEVTVSWKYKGEL
jgi:hypothetical protein